MALSEFQLIERYFHSLGGTDGVALGIGDDAAILDLPAAEQLVVAADTLLEGVHFPADCAAADIGYRSLAVNLSDLAAMAATPRWFTLCLTLPAADPGWLQDFSRGLAEAAALGGIALVGGDTTRGPLSISIQVMGSVMPGQALLRSGAGVGDLVAVTGTLGDAAGALSVLGEVDEHSAQLQAQYYRPRPRLAASRALRGIATSCIDVSDGLLADLGHICRASGVAAQLQAAQLPLSDALTALFPDKAQGFALAGGDDYELCFTLPVARQAQLDRALAGLHYTIIGEIRAGSGVSCVDDDGRPLPSSQGGYEHFNA